MTRSKARPPVSAIFRLHNQRMPSVSASALDRIYILNSESMPRMIPIEVLDDPSSIAEEISRNTQSPNAVIVVHARLEKRRRIVKQDVTYLRCVRPYAYIVTQPATHTTSPRQFKRWSGSGLFWNVLQRNVRSIQQNIT